jgi:membrane protease YdiL (CAAX protease family)
MEAPDRMRPLGAAATFGWALFVFAIANGAAVVLTWLCDRAPSSVDEIRYDGALVALVTLTTNPIQIALLAAVARWRVGSAMEYLGLTRFSRQDFLVGILAVAGLIALLDGISYLAGLDIVSPFQTEAFTSARADGWMWPLLLAIVVVGPAGEEIMFRGFLFRGWVVPGARGAIAIVVIALIWAGMHVQYDWFGIGQVFLTGLVLGWLRWRSGSTLLTILLHVLVNLEGSLETLAAMKWSAP